MEHKRNEGYVIVSNAILVIGLYELLGNPTTKLIEPPWPLIIVWKQYRVDKLTPKNEVRLRSPNNNNSNNNNNNNNNI